jgi:predicted kinase
MRLLILMRGVPGSGKSTLAKKLAEDYRLCGYTCEIHSTDNYFMVDGEYRFNLDLLGTNHVKNQQAVKDAMSRGVEVIIVDNTNLSAKERKKYIDAAVTFNYTTEVHDSTTPWAKNAVECAKRNTHGVPLETIQRMLQKLESDTNVL